MALIVELFTATSGVMARPYVELTVPKEFKILGGGAFDNWAGGEGNLLTASYPYGNPPRKWIAAGKDHEAPSPAAITAYASVNLPSPQAMPVSWRRSSVKLGPTWQAAQFALLRNNCRPACSSVQRAMRSLRTKRSNRESPERIDRTKLASTREIFRCEAHASRCFAERRSISFGSSMGLSACSSSVAARPSQKNKRP